MGIGKTAARLSVRLEESLSLPGMAAVGVVLGLLFAPASEFAALFGVGPGSLLPLFPQLVVLFGSFGLIGSAIARAATRTFGGGTWEETSSGRQMLILVVVTFPTIAVVGALFFASSTLMAML
jgi:hypothetical protein